MSTRVLRARRFLHAAVLLAMPASAALAVEGPSVTRVNDATWGAAGDLWPYVGKLEIDSTGTGAFGRTCTVTLIAPDIGITAAHCFESNPPTVPNDLVRPGAAIPAGLARVNFGALGTFPVVGGRVHPDYAMPNTPFAPIAHDLAWVQLNVGPNGVGTAPAAVSPAPMRLGGSDAAAGFIGTWSIGYGGTHAGQTKGYATTDADAYHAGGALMQQNIQGPPNGGGLGENFTEVGDSGGPGTQRWSGIPDRAWASNITSVTKNDFVATAVHGGSTPVVNPAPPPQFTYGGETDYWTRLDTEGNFINQGIALGAVTIYHNLPTDPAALSALDPTARVAVLFKANVNANEPYLMNLKVWEEDTSAAVENYKFTGDVGLRPTNFNDDLAGYGHSGGIVPAGKNAIYAWDVTTVAALLAFDEAGNPNDPVLDWTFQVNYADSGQTLDLNRPAMSYEDVLQQIEIAQNAINGGTAIRGGFAIVQGGIAVPEPGSLSVLSLGLLALRRRRR